MKTTFDIENIIYEELKHIVGVDGIYKRQRPVNSTSIDIVVGSLPITGEQIQRGVGNVNIHVPNLSVVVDGVQDNSQPDLITLKTLTDLVTEALKDKVYDGYWLDIQQQLLLSQGEEHYSNIRVNYYAFQN